MRKIIRTALLLFFAISIIPAAASAEDIWYASYNGYDYYLDTDSIDERVTENGHYIKLDILKVEDGELVGTEWYEFLKYRTGVWRYTMSGLRQDGHTLAVMTERKSVCRLLEACAEELDFEIGVRNDIRGVGYYF